MDGQTDGRTDGNRMPIPHLAKAGATKNVSGVTALVLCKLSDNVLYLSQLL